MLDIDVLIIGGGPTGLTLALELALQKVAFRIVDKATERSDKSRALLLQPRSLELLRRHGIAQDITQSGIPATAADLYVNRKKSATLEFDNLALDDSEFPVPYIVSQVDTERFLESRLERYGHRVEYATTAEGIHQDDHGASAILKRPPGKNEHVRCQYIIGCDGAHSAVRHATDLVFEGGSYHEQFILCDASLDWDHPIKHMSIMFGQGVLLMFPLRDGTVRLAGAWARRPLDRDPTLADFQAFFDETAPGRGVLSKPTWMTRYRLHHRCVTNYRSGRLFLAGDAAHIHSPIGGQGMNTGICDAANLGWKLAAVLRGEREDRFLDSYHDERHAVGTHLIRRTDRMFGFVASTGWLFMTVRNWLLPWFFPFVARDAGRRQGVLRFITQLGVRHRRSPIVGTDPDFAGPVRGGDRAPDGLVRRPEGEGHLMETCGSGGNSIILFTGLDDSAEAVQETDDMYARITEASKQHGHKWGEIHRLSAAPTTIDSDLEDINGDLHKKYGFDRAGYVVVRTDGYVAHVGLASNVDRLVAWLSQ